LELQLEVQFFEQLEFLGTYTMSMYPSLEDMKATELIKVCPLNSLLNAINISWIHFFKESLVNLYHICVFV